MSYSFSPSRMYAYTTSQYLLILIDILVTLSSYKLFLATLIIFYYLVGMCLRLLYFIKQKEIMLYIKYLVLIRVQAIVMLSTNVCNKIGFLSSYCLQNCLKVCLSCLTSLLYFYPRLQTGVASFLNSCLIQQVCLPLQQLLLLRRRRYLVSQQD